MLSTPSEKHSFHPRYRPDIDGLRALAILPVVVFHAFPRYAPGGFVGVDMFFAISGYLISLIIFRNLVSGTFSFAEFYAHRVRRIFPALIVVLVACYAIGWFALLPDEFKSLGKHIANSAGFVQNIVLQREAGYFDVASEMKPLLHLWSLAIEEQFYLVFPFFVWLFWRVHLKLLTGLILIALISFFLAEKGLRTDAVKAFYFPHTRFWELMIGGMLAYAQVFRAWPDVFSRALRWQVFNRVLFREAPPAVGQQLLMLNSFASAFGLLLIVVSIASYHAKIPWPGLRAIVPVLGTVFIIASGPQAWVNRTLLASKPMVWIGLISYPLYLWHWPLLAYLRILEDGTPLSEWLIAVVVTSFAMAVLTYWLIEKPIRFGKRSSTRVAALSALLGVIAGVGIFTKNHNFSDHTPQLSRKGYADLTRRFGSDRWYRGQDDWLFLGNAYDNTLRKLELRIIPSQEQIQTVKEQIAHLARFGVQHNIPVALIIGPNKNRVYSEYLPDELKPSQQRYSEFFLEALRTLPNLVVYDPLNDFLKNKTDGLLYWKTDTHWNQKGSLLAWQGLAKRLFLPELNVQLRTAATPHVGDLIGISGLKDFPLDMEDNFELVWFDQSELVTLPPLFESQKSTLPAQIVRNAKALTEKYVWVVGDSFTDGLSPYINATFQETYYVGHSDHLLPENKLLRLLEETDKKPDLIILVRVERSF